jgi:hypothetical protein
VCSVCVFRVRAVCVQCVCSVSVCAVCVQGVCIVGVVCVAMCGVSSRRNISDTTPRSLGDVFRDDGVSFTHR